MPIISGGPFTAFKPTADRLTPVNIIYIHSAIDNATRSLINMGQLPVTCGLFFSLGHSTIVIVVVRGLFYECRSLF